MLIHLCKENEVTDQLRGLCAADPLLSHMKKAGFLMTLLLSFPLLSSLPCLVLLNFFDILNFFISSFATLMLVYADRIANNEDPDRTAPLGAV